MDQIVPQMSFYKEGFGINQSTNADMSLNKESKPKINKAFFLARIIWFKTLVYFLYPINHLKLFDWLID